MWKKVHRSNWKTEGKAKRLKRNLENVVTVKITVSEAKSQTMLAV